MFLFFHLLSNYRDPEYSVVISLQNSSLHQTKQASSKIPSFNLPISFVYRSVDRFLFFFQMAYHLHNYFKNVESSVW